LQQLLAGLPPDFSPDFSPASRRFTRTFAPSKGSLSAALNFFLTEKAANPVLPFIKTL
jgi:hypothetical protein